MAEKKAVAKKEENLPAAIDFGADVGAGFEDADSQSFAIPILSVLQSGSPQCKRSRAEYIEGASEGALLNSVTQSIYDGEKGVLVVPCYYNRTINEWYPRDSKDGEGLVAVHNTADGEALLADSHEGPKGERMTEKGTVLNDTRNHYVLVIDEKTGAAQPMFFPLGSTQIKKSKRWMSLMNGIVFPENQQPKPMFSQIYRITTVPESNDKGDWSGIKIEHETEVTDAGIYQAAKNFREMVRSGVAKPSDSEPEPF